MTLASQVLRTLSAADEPRLLRYLRWSLGELRAALCFHRVSEERSKLGMPGAEIDRLICFLLEARGSLTVCFDDGYREAAEYVLSRAPRFPQVEWLYFVCPSRTERGESELASIDLCRDLQRLPNIALGNHTNQHERLSLLTPAQCRDEFETSLRDFQRLFGKQSHFAIPFGVPGVDFSEEHVEELRGLGRFLIWSTEPRPFHARERREGAVLPRFAVDGTRSWKETAVHIALHALRARICGEARA
jgi:hypothetical protein